MAELRGISTKAASIPPRWVKAPIGEIFSVVGGGTPDTSRPELWDGTIPWATSADIDEHGKIASRRAISEAGLRESAANRVPAGSVVVVTRVGLGKVGLAESDLSFSQDCQALLFPTDLLLPKFVAFQMRIAVLHFKFVGRGTTIIGVTKRQLLGTEFLIAPLPEQRRIVAEIEKQFTRLDAAVAGLERARAGLGRYQASVLKAACEGRLVPTEAELAKREGREYEPADQLLRCILEHRRARWAAEQGQKRKGIGRDSEGILKGYHEPPVLNSKGMSEVPEGWVWASVEMVGDVLLGRQRAPQYLTGRFARPYLRVANVKDDALDLRDIERMDFDEAHFAKYRLIPGDILVSEGQSPELVGQSAIFRGGIESLCFQKTLHRFRPVPEGPSSEFAQLVFRANVKSGVFRRVASITTNIAHLTLEKLKAAPFPLPPRAEQLRIVAEAERRLSIIAKLEDLAKTNLDRATRLRQAILKRAFEGGLAARDSNDEPASALLERIRASRVSGPPLKRPGFPRKNKSPVAAERAP